MSTRIIQTLVKKEMLDVFRDKKTVIMMLVVPIILYPLIFIGVMQLMAFVSSSMKEQNYRIVVEAEDEGRFLHKLEEFQKDRAESAGAENQAADETVRETTADTDGETDEEASGQSYEITIVDAGSITDYKEALNEEEIDVYVSGRMKDGKVQYEAYYLSSVENSSYAAGIVMDALDELKEDMTKQIITEQGMDIQAILEPIVYERQDIASSEQSIGNIIGSILPFMLVISLLMGTMYPAIDTTAGERERGTLETILTLPVTNRQLIISKFITVAVIGMVSAFLNILSMGVITLYMYKMLDMQTDMGSFDLAKFIPAILVCILAVFAFSLFISAVTMCVTSFAKSYKEANNYITPLMLIVMFVGYIGFIPNIELTQTIAMIPVANICLLIKNMMAFKIDYGAIAVVLSSNVAYAVIAILFLSKIYDSEAILFADGKAGLQLFERRSNLKKGGVPTVSDVWFVVAVTILLMLYVGSLLQIRFGLAGAFGTQMILLLVPLFLVVYTKRDIRQTYGFARTKAVNFLGGALISVGMVLLNLVITAALMKLFPQSTENMETVFSELFESNVVAAFVVIAVTPAVCEEMLFRGVIMHSMKAKYRVSSAIAITAVLFGLYHMSLVKFIPTGLIGLLLCLVAWKADSIYPAMLMHFINNAISVIVSYYPEQVEKVLPVFAKTTLSVSDALCLSGAGLVLVGIGWAVLVKARKADKAVIS
ncbi:MAG: CPBP family intramembrane metalloprotease [Lachnospiraceae bacterium]|nr:CPBP family intramembrane metalloprotease [Lachnospiraceae bacterium]